MHTVECLVDSLVCRFGQQWCRVVLDIRRSSSSRTQSLHLFQSSRSPFSDSTGYRLVNMALRTFSWTAVGLTMARTSAKIVAGTREQIWRHSVSRSRPNINLCWRCGISFSITERHKSKKRRTKKTDKESSNNQKILRNIRNSKWEAGKRTVEYRLILIDWMHFANLLYSYFWADIVKLLLVR